MLEPFRTVESPSWLSANVSRRLAAGVCCYFLSISVNTGVSRLYRTSQTLFSCVVALMWHWVSYRCLSGFCLPASVDWSQYCTALCWHRCWNWDWFLKRPASEFRGKLFEPCHLLIWGPNWAQRAVKPSWVCCCSQLLSAVWDPHDSMEAEPVKLEIFPSKGSCFSESLWKF